MRGGDRGLRPRAGSRLQVAGSMSAKTGVAPACTITLAVAQNVSGVVMTSSPGPTPDGEQRQVQGRGAGIDGHRVRRAGVVGEPALERRHARAGGQPAGFERGDDFGDFFGAEVGGANGTMDEVVVIRSTRGGAT